MGAGGEGRGAAVGRERPGGRGRGVAQQGGAQQEDIGKRGRAKTAQGDIWSSGASRREKGSV